MMAVMFCKDKMVIKRLSDGKGLPLCSTGTSGLGGLGGQNGPRPTLSMVRNTVKWIYKKRKHCHVSCPLVLVHVLVHFHFNLVNSVLVPFPVG